jgi:superfamily II DNA/RNA helicase
MPALAGALAHAGITEPFPIQEMTIPTALAGTDMIGQARTGTGKTLAFGLPLLQRIISPDEPEYAGAEDGQPQALVLTPTRELAVQVGEDLTSASMRRRMRILTLYGGRAYEPQIASLRAGVDVVVGTPGRILDLMGQRELNLSHVKIVVLDEADRMLDLGFLPDVEKILSATPVARQTMLFSATMPAAIMRLSRRYLTRPVNVRAEAAHEASTVPTTEQFVYRAHELDKDELVARILQAEGRGLTILFARTKRATQRMADELGKRGFAVGSLHGDLGQGAREQAMRAFRNGKVDVLVATDVAARGLDVDGVTHVVNLNCPEDAEAYLHRIGRTGRAGAAGVAVTLVDWRDVARWQTIARELDLPVDDPPETYSSSPTIYTDLHIPSSATGRLPRSQRTRAGLDAEQVEDLGETGRTAGGGERGSSGRDRGGSHGGGTRGRDGKRPRNRSRTRSGSSAQPDSRSAGSTGGQSSAAAAGDSSSSTGGSRRRRRRTRSGRPADGQTAGGGSGSDSQS